MRNYKKISSLVLLCTLLLTSVPYLNGCGKSGQTEKRTEAGTQSKDDTQHDDTQVDNSQTGGTEGQDTENAGADANGNASEDNTKFEPITMSFTGDVHLDNKLYGYYQAAGLNGFMSQRLVENFQKQDLMIIDHEYAATDLPESAKDTNQWFNFKAPIAYEKILKELGVDIVTLANNHTMDYGEQSLLDTLEALDNLEIGHVGAGKNLAEAKAAEIREINGKKIAVLGASRFILGYDWYAQENKAGIMTTYESTDRFQMVKDEITRLKTEEGCDVVAVFVHFGKEKTNQFNASQETIAHGYVDAGADLVIGSHAHTLQGIEIYKDAPIYYNLGNFLFANYAVDTMMVNVTIHEDNSITTQIVPCTAANYKVTDATGDKAQKILKYLESLSVNVDIDEDGNVTERDSL